MRNLGLTVRLFGLAQVPFLEKGDIIIDGGNSEYTDSTRRCRSLTAQGILCVLVFEACPGLYFTGWLAGTLARACPVAKRARAMGLPSCPAATRRPGDNFYCHFFIFFIFPVFVLGWWCG